MSTNLKVLPIKRSKLIVLEKELKYVVAPLLWGHDGTLYGQPIMIDKNDIKFFEDIVNDKTNNKVVKTEAQKIIDLIKKHKLLEILIEE